MNLIFQSIFLGIVQGLTEFLPISSSAHLVFFQQFFPLIKEFAIQFDLIFHLGTLFALIVFFFKDLKEILKAKDLILNIIISTIISAILIFPFKNLVEKAFTNYKLAGLMLFLTSLFLFLASYKKNNLKEKISFKNSLIIGFFQAFAVLPGISRSGITISSGILSGLDSKIATKFSFLLAIPLIFGAFLLEIKDFSLISHHLIIPLIFGFFFSFLFGLISLKLLTKILSLNQKKLIYFALYCLIFGIIIVFIV